jgi:hypothetical protein
MDGSKLFPTYYYDTDTVNPMYAAGEANFGTKNTREDEIAAMQVCAFGFVGRHVCVVACYGVREYMHACSCMYVSVCVCVCVCV